MQNSLVKLLGVFFFVFLLFGCQSDDKPIVDWSVPALMLENGQLARVESWADSLKNNSDVYSKIWMKADSFEQLAMRIALDFEVSESKVREQLLARIGDYSEAEWELWKTTGLLEGRVLNGERRYFKRAASNLAILTGKGDGLLDDALDAFCLEHTADVMAKTNTCKYSMVQQHSFIIDFVLTIDADVVPAGDTICCWLPFPKEIHGRQSNVKLLNVEPGNYQLSSDTCIHRSVYLEQVAIANSKTVFNLKFSFDSQAEYVNLSKEKVLPYDRASFVFKEYTKEQLPQINFSQNIRQLADSICGEEVNPFIQVRDIFYWIDKNIPWAGALEYGIMPDIPQYVLKNKKGDCGMQTLLFMAMARYRGIPVRWQSGWMLHPGEENLHDWCEVYYQGIGWVPLDMSFGLQDSNNQHLREFYMSGIDAYRLIINDGIGGEFYPAKKFLRSEPWDFQRGEVEWKGGNLYFNQWNYRLEVNYVDRN
ncbi:MAG: transglutaminase-like domain-containing protein [Carboxylicivirga sp.]|jgi:hypothetical protein|nr:transglutaminase-like domain-containing protein [Carboxylicivirga sp.]